MKATNLIVTLALAVAATAMSAQTFGNKKTNRYSNCRKSTQSVVLSLSEIVSGNGHGLGTAMNVSYKFCNNMLSVGFVQQNDYKKINALTFDYTRVFKGQSNIDLYANITGTYTHNALLSKKANQMTHTDEFLNEVATGTSAFEKFNTKEAYAGLGLTVNMGSSLTASAGIAAGVYCNQAQGTDNRCGRFVNAACGIGAGMQYKVQLAYRIKL